VQVQQWGFTVEDKHFIKELTAIKKKLMLLKILMQEKITQTSSEHS